MNYADNDCMLSVIIPVYNSEKTLRKTVDSVLDAQIENMELVLVDDGSTDNSASICDEYAENNRLFTVIHQRNAGISAARNVGMANAKGTYCFFLDSDDTVRKNLFECFINYLTLHDASPDVVAFDVQKLHAVTGETFPIGLQPLGENIDGLDGVSAVKAILQTDPKYEWYAWRYFYSTEFLNKHQFRFLEGFYYEDVEWTPRVLLKASLFGYMPVLGINYLYQNSSSILNTPSLKRYQDKAEISDRMIRYVDQNVPDKQLCLLLKSNFSSLYLSAVGGYLRGLSVLYHSLFQRKHILRYANTRFSRVLYLLCRVFGFRFGCLLTRMIIKARNI